MVIWAQNVSNYVDPKIIKRKLLETIAFGAFFVFLFVCFDGFEEKINISWCGQMQIIFKQS